MIEISSNKMSILIISRCLEGLESLKLLPLRAKANDVDETRPNRVIYISGNFPMAKADNLLDGSSL